MRSTRRCRSRVSMCSRRSFSLGGYDTVLFSNSVLAADVAAGLAARLDAGLNWDLVDLAEQGRRAGRPAPGVAGLGAGRCRLALASCGWRCSGPGSFDAVATGGGEPRIEEVTVPLQRAFASRHGS